MLNVHVELRNECQGDLLNFDVGRSKFALTALEYFCSVQWPQMQNAFRYYARFQSARTSMGSLPPFARSIVTLFALPGIICLLLSILAGLVSIFVLLLLTVPVYQVLQAVFGGRQPTSEALVPENPFASLFGQMSGGGVESPGRKQVEAKIIDAD